MTKMVVFDQEASAKKADRSDSVVLDMEILSSQVLDNGDYSSSPAMNRSLSRKASDWLERKTCEERDSDTSFSIKGGEHSTTGTESRVGLRRYMSGGRRTSAWLDPRRVLLFFATLSSMGTILLIYFTLSTTNINGDDGNAFQS